MSLAPCFKTRLRLHSDSGLNSYIPGPDVIVRPGQGPYLAAKEAVRDLCTQNPDVWLNQRIEVQTLDIDFIGADNITQATDLDWDTYLFTARQTITISDA